jgi:hypothetical protein
MAPGSLVAPNPDVNMEFGQIAKEIVAQTTATDEAEDGQFGEARGDELPEALRTPEGRREFLRRARQALRRDEGERPERIEEPGVGGRGRGAGAHANPGVCVRRGADHRRGWWSTPVAL